MSADAPSSAISKRPLWVAAVLLVTAALLAANPLPFKSPLRAVKAAPEWALDETPVRQPELTPYYEVAVFNYRCSECHKIIASDRETNRRLTQHREIVLKHGINTRCLNCHHRTNRDVFADDAGGEISWDQPQRLCAKCHGPVYRDWQAGSHGRTNGYWDKTKGEQTRKKCIECHDPHQPPFPPMKPAPGPQTLRMGDQRLKAHTSDHDPLRRSTHSVE